MNRHHGAVLWFILCALLSIFNIRTIQIFDGFDWPFYAVLVNAVVSTVGIAYHMRAEESERKRSGLTAWGPRVLLAANSVLVFPMLWLSLFTLSGEYHRPLWADATVAAADGVWQAGEGLEQDLVLIETDDLYVYRPNYDSLAYVCGTRPSRDDLGILLCVSAAFQSTYQFGFSEDNIVGWHTSEGRLERGKPQVGLEAFTYVDGVARIWDTDEAEQAVRAATEGGGFGYQSFIVLKDGRQGDFGTHEFRCFRALAIVDGRAYVIESRTLTHYGDFVRALIRLGVSDAIYCDMGSGWNYSWYRADDGHTETIIGMPWPFSHNWLTFRRDTA